MFKGEKILLLRMQKMLSWMCKMDDKFYEELKKKIQPYFEENGSHAFDHTQRVYNLALRIAKTEDGGLDIVKASALLHDIARKKQDEFEGKICHAEEGAKMAEKILREMNFLEDKIEKVKHCIEVHRYSKKLEPQSIEAKILCDADRLDALGAITIGRMFSTGGKINRPLHNPEIPPEEDSKKKGYSGTTINGFYNKILKLKSETFYTKEAQKIAQERYKFVEEFVDRFVKEWEGEL
jgi:uncharacterized protein